jgi:hypothetical protein
MVLIVCGKKIVLRANMGETDNSAYMRRQS